MGGRGGLQLLPSSCCKQLLQGAYRTSVMALPHCWPGMKLVSMALTWAFHGVRIAPGTVSTTTVSGLAAATASISAFWFLALMPSSNDSDWRSEPSPESVPANTMAMSAALA